MSDIDFRRKINWQRYYPSSEGGAGEHKILRVFESDRGRIINSPAIRRLQQKTQVFPLERNAAVRSRLTHSMEVQQVGRYIAREILSYLKDHELLAKYGLDELSGPFESIVEMACLMHDIGNPPFGHFGEAAINDWFRQRLKPEDVAENDSCEIPALRKVSTNDSLNMLRDKVRQDLCHFEGNAQGIRLVHTLLRLNLTWAQVGCIMKYTRPAWDSQPPPGGWPYLKKKPGFYLSEEGYISRLRTALDLGEYCRFPLTWIMEAADDISYCVADLEDAVEKKIFTVDQLYEYLCSSWNETSGGQLFTEVVKDALDKAYRKSEAEGGNGAEKSRALPEGKAKRNVKNQFFLNLRVNTLNKLVPYAAQRFIDNIDSIFAGSFNGALLEDKSEHSSLLKVYKQVALAHVFSHPDVEQLELQGYRVITGLLDIYRPLLMLSLADFQQLVEHNRVSGKPIETRLYHKLSSSHCQAYIDVMEKLSPHNPQYEVLEFYYRCRLIQDYISGMTDLYAWDEYRRLMAVT
ncbi:dGTPase [Enterobacteriaceae bacterium 4M9]|nr:dGTPase [Enterobacteriaceae bacterium 4M9]